MRLAIASDSVTPWAVACQFPPFTVFSREESWSGLPCPSPGEKHPHPLASPALTGRFFTTRTASSVDLSPELRRAALDDFALTVHPPVSHLKNKHACFHHSGGCSQASFPLRPFCLTHRPLPSLCVFPRPFFCVELCSNLLLFGPQ